MTQLWRARVDDCGESESRRRSESDFEIQKKTGANQTRSYFELCIDLCGGLMFPFFWNDLCTWFISPCFCNYLNGDLFIVFKRTRRVEH
jgi:hypothetical protein